MTDENTYKKQLYIKLFPEKSSIEIDIPVEARVRRNKEFEAVIGLSVGMWQLFTSDTGRIYGEQFGCLRQELETFISRGNRAYAKEKRNNPGRQKYKAGKDRLEAGLHTYINQEINRMLQAEKPRTVYIPRFPQSSPKGAKGKVNYSVTLWQKGYVRKRLRQKCLEKGIELAEVFGNNISRECSRCGSMGAYEKDTFRCSACGYEDDKKRNAAINVKRRGQSGQCIGREFMPYGSK